VTKPDRIRQTPADMTGNELDFNLKRKKRHQRTDNLDDHRDRVFFEDDDEADGGQVEAEN
jgi:hypothetical protein